jgi:hypothetical protein
LVIRQKKRANATSGNFLVTLTLKSELFLVTFTPKMQLFLVHVPENRNLSSDHLATK